MHPPDEICNNLRKVAANITATLRILHWVQLAVAVVSLVLLIYFSLSVVGATAKAQPKIEVAASNNAEDPNFTRILLLINVLGGTTALGMLGRFKRTQRKDLSQTHAEMRIYCPETIKK